VWDRESIYRCLTRATQLPTGAEVREWYNDYAIFLSTYTKEITRESGEDSFFVLCATYTGFILPMERLKAWLTEHQQDTTLADEVFTGLIAEVAEQESQESDNEFIEDKEAQHPIAEEQRKKPPSNIPISSVHGNNSTTPITGKTNHPPNQPMRRGVYPFEIKRLIDTTLYFLDRDTMFSMI
jgi:hypothetical protein